MRREKTSMEGVRGKSVVTKGINLVWRGKTMEEEEETTQNEVERRTTGERGKDEYKGI